MIKLFRAILDFFVKDIVRKLISLTFALLVWISVKNTIGVEKLLQEKVPVVFSLPPNLIMTNTTPQKVRLKVRASERLLAKLQPGDFTVNVPIKFSQYKKGKPLNIRVTPSNVSCPLGVTVVSVEDAGVIAYLDKIISKPVKVIPIFSGEQDGYTTGMVKLVPSEVIVSGPSSSIEPMQTIETLPIPLAHMTESFEYETKLVFSKPVISISKSSVLAKVEILKSIDSFTLTDIPVRILNTTENAERFDIKLETETVNVLISGSKSDVELVKSDQVKAFLDISSLNEAGSYKVDVDCSISRSKAVIKDVTPGIIKVTITEK